MSFLERDGGKPAIILPAILDITMAAALKQDCQAAVAGGEGLVVDAGAVSLVSSPCLQVLAAAARALSVSGGPGLVYRDASDRFRKSVTGLALNAALGLGDT
jgi:anti-anti-sigma regulatory factor